jgi:hypothetical protein
MWLKAYKYHVLLGTYMRFEDESTSLMHDIIGLPITTLAL